MSLFEGHWRLDSDSSLVWDATRGLYQPDEVGEEMIQISESDGAQEYEVLYGETPQIRMGYRCAYDQPVWENYIVRDIRAVNGDVERAVAEFKERIRATNGTMSRNFEVGKSYGLVRLVSGDDRTHYRLGGDPTTGRVVYSMMRRLEDSGDAYVARVFDVDGVVNRIRRFVRISADEYQIR